MAAQTPSSCYWLDFFLLPRAGLTTSIPSAATAVPSPALARERPPQAKFPSAGSRTGSSPHSPPLALDRAFLCLSVAAASSTPYHAFPPMMQRPTPPLLRHRSPQVVSQASRSTPLSTLLSTGSRER